MLSYSNEESVGWNDGSWLFPRVVELLEIEQYRGQLLAGLILSTSTKTDSTVSELICPPRLLLNVVF